MTRTQHTSWALRFARAFSFGVAAYVVLYAFASPHSTAPAWHLTVGALATGAVIAGADLTWRALRRIVNGPQHYHDSAPADEPGRVIINLFTTHGPAADAPGQTPARSHDGPVTRRSA
jgi:hypothetical protein